MSSQEAQETRTSWTIGEALEPVGVAEGRKDSLGGELEEMKRRKTSKLFVCLGERTSLPVQSKINIVLLKLGFLLSGPTNVSNRREAVKL